MNTHDPIAREAKFAKLLQAAVHALRSFQYGNSSQEFAGAMADDIEAQKFPRGPIMVSWEWVQPNLTWFAHVPATDHHGNGFLDIHAIMRPKYCDRGRWHVLIVPHGVAAPDEQEGFPRYYFSLANLKDEMEAWVNKRDKCIRAHQKALTTQPPTTTTP